MKYLDSLQVWLCHILVYLERLADESNTFGGGGDETYLTGRQSEMHNVLYVWADRPLALEGEREREGSPLMLHNVCINHLKL